MKQTNTQPPKKSQNGTYRSSLIKWQNHSVTIKEKEDGIVVTTIGTYPSTHVYMYILVYIMCQGLR